ncbi:hypothetical protein PLESTM_001632000 [Pleodorina starrii]|nr:hypothetical protein PLESTM_001632000 [Pleodorina starrii]
MLASPGQAASFVACVSMGVVGNLPFGLAPGMGINAYVHSSEGIGLISFESATLVTLGGCRVEDRAPLYGVIVGVCSYLLLYLLLLGYDLLTAIL